MHMYARKYEILYFVYPSISAALFTSFTSCMVTSHMHFIHYIEFCRRVVCFWSSLLPYCNSMNDPKQWSVLPKVCESSKRLCKSIRTLRLLTIIPARDPKQCGGSKEIMYHNVDDVDDDDDHGDDDNDDGDDDDDGDADDDDDDDDGGDDDGDVDADDDDDEEERKMMMWKLRRRRRKMRMLRRMKMRMLRRMKMRMLRRMMLRRNTDPQTGKHTLCEPAQSKCTWTCHKRCGILQGWCQTRIPGPTFCASLRSRNEHGHVTKGILCRNLQGKCQMLPIPPRLNTGP